MGACGDLFPRCVPQRQRKGAQPSRSDADIDRPAGHAGLSADAGPVPLEPSRREPMPASAARSCAMRRTKWIDVESPEEPVSRVARRALQGRLELVWYYLPAAALEPEEDIEYVHQLRVSTRRAMAALEIFESLAPRKRRKWFAKQLKRIRKAAGDARDYDVMLQRLAPICEAEQGGAGQRFLKWLAERRADAQAPIRAIHRRLVKRRFPRRIDTLVARVRFRGGPDRQEPSFACAARSNLRPLAEAFFAAGAADLSSVAALHQFRIQGKLLRYAMEVFAGAFGPALRKELYPIVEQLQERLGKINDHATAAARYQAWLAEIDDPGQRQLLSDLAEGEASALEAERRTFLAWWTPERAADLRWRLDEEFAACPGGAPESNRQKL
jgi:CHAD domain-containing protein